MSPGSIRAFALKVVRGNPENFQIFGLGPGRMRRYRLLPLSELIPPIGQLTATVAEDSDLRGQDFESFRDLIFSDRLSI